MAIRPLDAYAGHDPVLQGEADVAGGIPVSHFAITYVLLVPLVIFAAHGGFSLEHSSWNTDLGAVGGKMAVVPSASETLRDRVQAWLALGTCLVVSLPYMRSVFGTAQRLPAMVLLPLFAIASAGWSQDAGLSLRSGLSLTVTTLFAFYLAERFQESELLELLVLTGACVGVLSVVLALFWPRFGLDHSLHEGAWQGIYTQKNACAESTLFLLTPALSLLPGGRYGQLLRICYIVLCLSLIAMSQSRTGWVMTILYFGFAASLRVVGRFGRKELLPLLAAIFALGGALLAALATPSSWLTAIHRSGSVSGRAQIWGAVIASIGRRPIAGYGFDAVWSVLHGEATRIFATTGWVVTGAHCGFLNVALELGLVGLLLVGVTLVQACRHANVAFCPGRSRYVDWCIGIVFLTVLYNLDERTLMAPQYLPWILYIVACIGLLKAACPVSDGEVFTETAEVES
jgi:O-antigen ligase